MPVRTEPTEDFLGIVHTGSGVVTGDELAEACHTALQVVQSTKNFHYEFVDLTDATELRMKAGDLERITEKDRLAATYRPDAVIVIVAPRDAFHELAKIWERRVHDLGRSVYISRERAEGLQWLRANFRKPHVEPTTTAQD